ncbi:proline dehydrogenase family protein [Paeniglutamicibacter kerguelensis]|uniref:Proline dehydrogenase n=1 Tax=Paeniglutamicibacter kerguelensis TaxID=254788 RepID=A0ABS4XBB6_9MICC|nr:proline dehydrogenase family protein [Paeniglutamicibacter kerguelensis]MBP2385760.1 proline dehydrogenase [Paeniglutamicibacter kerguelensis]
MTSAYELERAADTLRTFALDEGMKARVMSSPVLAEMATRVSRRYTAGDTVEDAIRVARKAADRGHRISIEYAGESVRTRELAVSEAGVFLDVAAALADSTLPGTISFDLTHLGALVERELALEHVRALARATETQGTILMISAEGSDRTDLILDLYDQLADEIPRIGITLQARLHRTPADLERVLRRPGRIRLVKGAFLEPESVAYPRNSEELSAAYRSLAARLVESGHSAAFATHDGELVYALIAEHGDALKGGAVEFEMLLGLGTQLMDQLRAEGYATREYIVFGGEWWLYVLNRMAEHPERALAALADMNPDPAA